MGWVGIVLWIITHAPELISIVRAIIDLIRALPKADQDAARLELGDAVKARDKSALKSILEKWHKRCTGTGCPADLVGE